MSTKFQRIDHQSIIDLYLQNKTITEIEQESGISWFLIKKILLKNNLIIKVNGVKKNEIDSEYLIKRYSEERHMKTLSNEFGVSISLLSKILKENNIEIKEKIVLDENIINKFKECNNIEKTAKDLMIGKGRVLTILKKHNIEYYRLKRVNIGDKFGMLTVIGIANPRISKNGNETKRFQCECECGGKIISIGVKLNSGKIWNCGCIWNKKRESVLMEKKRRQELKLDKIEKSVIKKNEKLIEKEKKREEYNQKKKEREINVGDKFNRWTVIGILDNKKYECKCECGTIRILTHINIKKSISCGCYHREISTKHGFFSGGDKDENRLMYTRYKSMKRRCYNPSNKNYKYYGAIGIKVCDRWMESNGQGYINFCEDMGPRPSKKHSLDRENAYGNYEPNNCRWVTGSVQSKNQRRYYKDDEKKETFIISNEMKNNK